MKFLLCGLNFSPELVGIGKYTGELAQTLVQQGHQVTVVTAPPYYPGWEIFSGFSGKRYSRETRQNLTVIRCPLWVPTKVTGIKRVLHLLSFALSSALVINREARQKPDLIFVVAPALLSAPAAARAGKRCGVPTWLHIQDFEVDAARNLGILGGDSFLRFRYLFKFESDIFNHFDRVSSISSKMVDRLVEKDVPRSKIVLFPNWIDSAEIFPLAAPSEYRSMLGLTDQDIVVLYSGSMGAKQGLEVLIESARLLRDHSYLHFVVSGDGPTKSELQESARGLPNVHFFPLQPAEKLNQLLNLADIHLLPQRKDAADLVMPSKLLGILASAKPVIACCLPGSELYRVVEQVGVPVQPENSEALSVAISELAGDPLKRLELGQEGRSYCIEQFSKEKVISRFLAQVEELLR